jgi:hypothetical protein
MVAPCALVASPLAAGAKSEAASVLVCAASETDDIEDLHTPWVH